MWFILESTGKLLWGLVHLSISSKLALTDGIPHHSTNTIRCVGQYHYLHPPSNQPVPSLPVPDGSVSTRMFTPLFLHSPQNQLHRHRWSLPLPLCTRNPKKLIILCLLISQPHPHRCWETAHDRTTLLLPTLSLTWCGSFNDWWFTVVDRWTTLCSDTCCSDQRTYHREAGRMATA